MFDVIVFPFNDDDPELVVDSRLLAEGLGVQHDNLIQTININRVTIESSCGSLREGKDSTGKAGRPQNFFFLTERQFVLIGVFTSNTEKAKKFKVRVVNAFFEMRDALQKQAISPFNNYTLQRISLHHSNLES